MFQNIFPDYIYISHHGDVFHTSALMKRKGKYFDRKVKPLIHLHLRHYILQEAMENFVFPEEIKTKLMNMSKLKSIFYFP